MLRSEDLTYRWFVIRTWFDYLVNTYSVRSAIGDFSDQSEIKDGEDVNVLRSPDLIPDSTQILT